MYRVKLILQMQKVRARKIDEVIQRREEKENTIEKAKKLRRTREKKIFVFLSPIFNFPSSQVEENFFLVMQFPAKKRKCVSRLSPYLSSLFFQFIPRFT